MLEVGLKGVSETVVSTSNTAITMGSGDLEVFATPSMVAIMEQAAKNAVSAVLEDGLTTVGTLLNLSHVAATPLCMKVTAEAEVTAIEGRKLVYSVKAYDETGLIGEGTHERFVVNSEKFMSKVNSKK